MMIASFASPSHAQYRGKCDPVPKNLIAGLNPRYLADMDHNAMLWHDTVLKPARTGTTGA
jgi:hypothetical protein